MPISATNSSAAFKVGTRSSRLALLQAQHAVALLQACLPAAEWGLVPTSSPGDRDQRSDLRLSPADFFTRDLDDALRSGAIDCAVHSAKDLPEPVPADLDWCWLPAPADPRDALILRPGVTLADLPPDLRLGVSSQRREAYCRQRFPAAVLSPIRGTIELRLAQLDRGDFDALIMAGCALVRLGLSERISEWVSLEDLPTPPGQGSLALTFRLGDPRFLAIRNLFVKAVTFAGAGAGSVEHATLATVQALRSCDVCLHDALLDSALLDYLPKGSQCIDVGKRCKKHSRSQEEICERLTVEARRGRRVLRLKGGDPGIFGRLAEETAALDWLCIPYRVLPAVTSLTAATTGTGMLLTQRGATTGFSVLTPRRSGGGRAEVTASARAALPLVLFMAVKLAGELADELMADGVPGDTPAAVVFDAGGLGERIVSTSLARLGAECAAADTGAPGLLLIGEPARSLFPRWGALAGRRVLLTCSDTVLADAVLAVRDLGGVPIPWPLVRLEPAAGAAAALRDVETYDWVILSSPSAVRVLQTLAREGRVDLRRLPRLLVAGASTARHLQDLGIGADAIPEAQYGADGIVTTAREVMRPGSRVLRLRSDRAGGTLAARLRALDLEVADAVFYVTKALPPKELPGYDAAFFASNSAVSCFLERHGSACLQQRLVVAIGAPTAVALREAGVGHTICPERHTVPAAIEALGRHCISTSLENLSCPSIPCPCAFDA